MQRAIRPFVIVIAFALGCVATSSVVSTSQASSDATPESSGITCRDWFLIPPRFREPPIEGGASGTVTLPPGWEPVAGGPTSGSSSIVIACRRN